MSETIEERVSGFLTEQREKLSDMRQSEKVFLERGASTQLIIVRQGIKKQEAIISLLDDLMAERGKSVNLDEIFPKEVMEKAKVFGCLDTEEIECEPSETIEGAVYGYLNDIGASYGELYEVRIMAYTGDDVYGDDNDEGGLSGTLRPFTETARKVGLSLKIEEVED